MGSSILVYVNSFGTDTSKNVAGLTPNQSYHWRVRAICLTPAHGRLWTHSLRLVKFPIRIGRARSLETEQD